MNDLQKDAEKLRAHLAILHEQRDERPDCVTKLPSWSQPHECGMEWWVYEIEEMTKEVNLFRRELGKEDLTPADIYRVEKEAEGHADYARKFAFYCAELIHDVHRRMW